MTESEGPDVKNYKPGLAQGVYSCTHMPTMGVKGSVNLPISQLYKIVAYIMSYSLIGLVSSAFIA